MTDRAGDIRCCKGCGKAILFATSAATGKLIPLDATTPIYEVRGDKDNAPVAKKTEVGYHVSHFHTCTKANEFSGSKKK